MTVWWIQRESCYKRTERKMVLPTLQLLSRHFVSCNIITAGTAWTYLVALQLDLYKKKTDVETLVECRLTVQTISIQRNQTNWNRINKSVSCSGQNLTLRVYYQSLELPAWSAANTAQAGVHPASFKLNTTWSLLTKSTGKDQLEQLCWLFHSWAGRQLKLWSFFDSPASLGKFHSQWSL